MNFNCGFRLSHVLAGIWNEVVGPSSTSLIIPIFGIQIRENAVTLLHGLIKEKVQCITVLLITWVMESGIGGSCGETWMGSRSGNACEGSPKNFWCWSALRWTCSVMDICAALLCTAALWSCSVFGCISGLLYLATNTHIKVKVMGAWNM